MSTSHTKSGIIAIVGPTSSGKSDLAVALAKKLRGEVISADSRQVYRSMDIGTGKVPGKWQTTKGKAKEKKVFIYKGIPHHVIDFVSPKRKYTAEHFRKDAARAIKQILAQGHLPIISGGTGFYIDALLYNYAFPNVKPNNVLRRKLARESPETLFEKLRACDPERATAIDRKNKVRLIRALEIALTTEKPIPYLARTPHYKTLKIGIAVQKEILKKKIYNRLLQRLRKGMISEVRDLYAHGVSWKRLCEFGLEYRAVARHLRGEISKKELVDTLRKEIEQYAKRQMTWFKRDLEIQWVKKSKEALSLARAFLKNPHR